jgi:hypothetical protein
LNKTKLISTLKKCSEKELQLFRKWLNSPFHNERESLKDMYEFLLKAAPEFEEKKINKEKAFKYLFKNQDFQELRINTIISRLTRQLFDFLAYQNFQNSGQLAKICLMDELLEKDLSELMLKEGRKLKKEKAKSTFQNSSHYFNEYLYYKQLDEHFHQKPKRIYDENLQLKSDNLDLFYMSTKLKVACDMANRNTVIKANYECHSLDYLIGLIENDLDTYSQQPAIIIYYRILNMIQQNVITDYKEVKVLLANNLHCFPNKEVALLYGYFLNFCIKQINQGDSTFYKEVLELYKFLLVNRIIFENGYLLQWDYKNIITVGTRLNELEWTEQFIHEYKTHLPPKLRENAYVYNLANFYHTTKAYKKSLQLLHEVKFIDTSYHLGAKIIQLKSYYELNETEAFYALNDAFKIYLMRSKDLSTYRKQANMNLLRFALRIFKLKEEQEYIHQSTFLKKRQRIEEQLNKIKNIANLQWLKNCLEKITD